MQVCQVIEIKRLGICVYYIVRVNVVCRSRRVAFGDEHMAVVLFR